MENFDHIGQKEIFCRFIRKKNGQVVYPKNSKYFHFWVNDTRDAQDKPEQISMFDNDTRE